MALTDTTIPAPVDDVAIALDALTEYVEGQQEGQIVLTRTGDEWVIGATFGREAEDSPMAGGATYGHGATLAEALAAPARDLRLRDHAHPVVWDFEHSDSRMGVEGHGHTIACAQAHVDAAMREWGIHDLRFVVSAVDELPAQHDPVAGEDIGPFTLAYGEYLEAPSE